MDHSTRIKMGLLFLAASVGIGFLSWWQMSSIQIDDSSNIEIQANSKSDKLAPIHLRPSAQNQVGAEHPFKLASLNERTESIEDFEQRLAIFPTVFWEPLDTVSLRKLIRETPLVREKRILEIGTGSGLVSLCCAKAEAKSVVATDVNPNAIACAQSNAKRLDVASKIDFRLVDTKNAKAFAVIKADERFDLIISNPPWEEGKPASIDQYALYDPNFELLKSLLVEARMHLSSDGELYLAYGCKAAIRLLEKLSTELDYEFQVLDERKLDDLTEVFLPGMLLKLKPKAPKSIPN